jgi:hypothetical protein
MNFPGKEVGIVTIKNVYHSEDNDMRLKMPIILITSQNGYITLAGTVFEADAIARDVWTGVERGKFFIHHGFDGFMLATLTSGMSPVHSIWDATTQVWTC